MKKVAILFSSSVKGRVGVGERNVFVEFENMKENRYVHLSSAHPPLPFPHEIVKPVKLNYAIKRRETYKIHTQISIIRTYHSLYWISASPKGLAFPIVWQGEGNSNLEKQSQLFILLGEHICCNNRPAFQHLSRNYFSKKRPQTCLSEEGILCAVTEESDVSLGAWPVYFCRVISSRPW